ncbi:MAG TPA: RsmE family RNA methyltransferase [Candidatus Dormibacteraeota bacterium]
MPFFFGRRDGDRVVIEGADARHLARSLRARPGERISVVEPGALLSVRLVSVAADSVTGMVEASRPHDVEPSVRVTVGLALLPAAALEEALARCTELGAWSFIVISAARSVGRGARLERWSAICREAAMLAGRWHVPSVSGPIAVSELPADAVLLDRGAAEPLAALDLGSRSEATLLIGPEGGWTEEEAARFARRASLGPRNLRAPNAAAAAVAIALAGR